jgi:hypothetical protein
MKSKCELPVQQVRASLDNHILLSPSTSPDSNQLRHYPHNTIDIVPHLPFSATQILLDTLHHHSLPNHMSFSGILFDLW